MAFGYPATLSQCVTSFFLTKKESIETLKPAVGWRHSIAWKKSEVKQANPRPKWKGLQQNTKCDKDILWIQVLDFWGWKNIKAHRRVDIGNGPIYGICLTNTSILHRSHERDMTNVTKSQETQFSCLSFQASEQVLWSSGAITQEKEQPSFGRSQ